jgi:undecaprenyl-diphosphatase
VRSTPPTESADRSAPEQRFGARVLLAAAALVLVSVPFALLLFLVQDAWPPLERADAGARDTLNGYALAHPAFVHLMKALSFIGSFPVYLVVFAALAGWLLRQRLPRLALFVVVTALGSSLLNLAVKLAVDRARPVLPDPVAHANGLSFPSGHAQAAVVGYAVLLLVFLPVLGRAWRLTAIVTAVVLVLGIGFSRVALGVHYASDVVAGYVLGAAWVAVMAAAFEAWRRDRALPRPDRARDSSRPRPTASAPAARLPVTATETHRVPAVLTEPAAGAARRTPGHPAAAAARP